VFTLTDYAQNPGMDKWLVEFLIREYQQVTFFPQGTGDTQYLESLGIDGADNIKHLKPSLDDYNHLLETEAIDYVGVRLHGGIRALQYGRRAIVIAVDNRAECISRDTGLPIVPREQIPSKLEQMVNQTFSIELKIDREKIDRFLSAFNQHYAASLHLVA
jgi:polysaccharide pyruvyl transferase WcaK-like protein